MNLRHSARHRGERSVTRSAVLLRSARRAGAHHNLTPTTAFAYRDAPESGFGPGLDEPAATALVIPITAEGVDIFGGEKGSGAFLEAIRSQGGGIILVEARRATTQPLILSVAKPDGTVLLEIALPLAVSAPPSLAVDANRDGQITLPGEDNADAVLIIRAGP